MKTLIDLQRDIAKARADMAAFGESLPRIVGVETVKVIKQNFRLQGYDSGSGVVKWDKRTKATNKAYDRGKTLNKKTGKLSRSRSGVNSTYKGSVFSSSKPILDQTGTLKNSIHALVNGNSVFIGVDLGLVPYAKIHNEGGKIAVAAHSSVVHFKKTGENAKTGNLRGRFSAKLKADYAQKVKVGAHSISMPKRQYMPLPGQDGNPKIKLVVKRWIDRETAKIMKQFA